MRQRTEMLPIFLIFLFYRVEAQFGSSGCQTPDGQTGICLPLRSCLPISKIVDSLPKPPPKNIAAKLKQYQCKPIGRPIKVCCPPNDPDFSDKPNTVEIPEYEFPDVSNHRNLNLLPEDCGVLDTVKKIVNGNKTKLFEFPWMALLSYKTKKGVEFKCGGTIINEKYILTAAHCVTNLNKDGDNIALAGVRVGEHNTKTKKDCEEDEETEEEICAPPVQDLKIEQVIVHEKYDAVRQLNDITVLRVSKINLDLENSRPVCLPLENTGNFNYTNRRVVVTGWGYTETGRPSSELLKAELPVVPVESCKKLYKRYQISEKQICAGGDKKSDSCSGDSGGPLHFIHRLNGELRYIQQGIVSFGPRDCGILPLPGVYTRVAAYLDWILDKLRP